MNNAIRGIGNCYPDQGVFSVRGEVHKLCDKIKIYSFLIHDRPTNPSKSGKGFTSIE